MPSPRSVAPHLNVARFPTIPAHRRLATASSGLTSSMTTSHMSRTLSPPSVQLLTMPAIASTSTLVGGLALLRLFSSRCGESNGLSGDLAHCHLVVICFKSKLGDYIRGNRLCFSNRGWVVVQQNNFFPLFYPLLLIYLLVTSYPLSSVPLYLSPLSTFSCATCT